MSRNRDELKKGLPKLESMLIDFLLDSGIGPKHIKMNVIMRYTPEIQKCCDEHTRAVQIALKEHEDTLKALEQKRGTWDGVDVDKYMDEVRGREPEKPMNQEGLEEEIKRYYDDWDGDCRYTQVARHFADWQKEQDEMSKVNYEGARAVYDNTVQHLQEKIDEKYELGKKDMREQMLKDAIEGEVRHCATTHYVKPNEVQLAERLKQFQNGDEVRIIILPKEG